MFGMTKPTRERGYKALRTWLLTSLKIEHLELPFTLKGQQENGFQRGQDGLPFGAKR